MSRIRVHEVSSPISLFPFIGILLCTMGALLVILVAVSRSAHDSAVEQVASEQQVVAAALDERAQKKIDDVKRYVGSLHTVRGEAERKLRDEQSRLSQVEDHIRRLQHKLRSLQLADAELEALEKEHYDDRQQAEREVERLQQLISESQKTIDDLRESSANEPRSYAVVPYEGPNGTYRRPIYIECLKDELILQPEGVRIATSDLRPPFGAGNPLAATLRAGRDHLMRLYPKEAQSRDTQPYPLLLVRPEGLIAYDRARQAVEAGDFDLGFELVESDWKLKFPQADPQLATVEQQALQQALARQEVLAAAAPRAYHNPSLVVVGVGSDEDFGDYSGGGGFSKGGTGDGGSGGGGSGISGYGNGGSGSGGGNGGGNSNGGTNSGGPGGGPGSAQADGGAGNGGPSQGGPGEGVGGSAVAMGGTGGGPAGGSGGGAGGAGGVGGSSEDGVGMPAMGNSGDGQSSTDGSAIPQNVSIMTSTAPTDSMGDDSGSASPTIQGQKTSFDARGKDWALRQKPPRAVPVRRTIRVAVSENQLAILLEDATAAPGATASKTIPLHGDTVESIDEFVKQVRDQVDGWGIAGNGLYWRPVIDLKVGPTGQQRANDLARLLKNSGLELRADETAQNTSAGTPHETR